LREFPVVLEFPIQWGDLDAYGHVNNGVYLKWFESARAAYALRVGVEILPRQQGVGAIVASLKCNYLRPLGYPGHIFVGVRVTRVSLGGVTLAFRIVDGRIGVPVAEGACDAVFYDYARDAPVSIPAPIRAAVEQLEQKSFES
jgi:acyl-CoA thioester hydrolase